MKRLPKKSNRLSLPHAPPIWWWRGLTTIECQRKPSVEEMTLRARGRLPRPKPIACRIEAPLSTTFAIAFVLHSAYSIRGAIRFGLGEIFSVKERTPRPKSMACSSLVVVKPCVHRHEEAAQKVKPSFPTPRASDLVVARFDNYRVSAKAFGRGDDFEGTRALAETETDRMPNRSSTINHFRHCVRAALSVLDSRCHSFRSRRNLLCQGTHSSTEEHGV